MKTFTNFLSIFFIIVALSTSAQNLEFSRVMLVDSIGDVVPAGKIWKIESVMSKRDRTTFSPYTIIVNNRDVYMGDYSFSGKGWIDLESIDVYYKENVSCATTPTLYFYISGYEGRTPFWGRKFYGTVQNSASWHLVYSVTPQVPGMPLQITSAKLYISYWEAADVKLDFTYLDGTTYSMTIPGYQSSVCQSNYWQFISATPGSSSSTVDYAEVPEAELYTIDTRLPIWLPAGTTLAAGDNVLSVSVVEFTVVP